MASNTHGTLGATAPIIVPSAPEGVFFGASEEERNQLFSGPHRITRNLLPIVQDPAFFNESVKGKNPSTITEKGFARGLKWEHYDITAASDFRQILADYRLGFGCRGGADAGILFIDFDSEDRAAADWLKRTIYEINPSTPIRSRSNSQHFQALIRCDAAADDKSVWLPKIEDLPIDDNGGHIELRADSKHYSVLVGTHPSGVRFDWDLEPFNGDPWDADSVRILYKAIRDRSARHKPKTAQTAVTTHPEAIAQPLAQVPAQEPQGKRLDDKTFLDLFSILLEPVNGKPLFDPGPRNSTQVVKDRDGNDVKVPAYIDVTFALAEYRADQRARVLWNNWCALTEEGAAKHKASDWDEFLKSGEAAKDLNGKPYRIASLFKAARLLGWKSHSEKEKAKKPLLSFSLFKDNWDQPPKIDPLVDGFFDRGCVIVVSGQSGCGKTLILVDLTRAVTTGTEWCDRPCIKGDVVLIAKEGQNALRNRFWANLKGNGLSDDQIKEAVRHIHALSPEARGVVFGKSLRDRDSESAAERIEQELRDAGINPVLFVIDTLSQTLLGEENSSTDVAAYFNDIVDHLTRPFNACTIITHHHAKGTDQYRGSTAIVANSDDKYTVSSKLVESSSNVDGVEIVLKCDQRRDGAKPDGAVFKVSTIAREEDPTHPLIFATFDHFSQSQTKRQMSYEAFDSYLDRHAADFIGKHRDSLLEPLTDIMVSCGYPKESSSFRKQRSRILNDIEDNNVVVYKNPNISNPVISHVKGFEAKEPIELP